MDFDRNHKNLINFTHFQCSNNTKKIKTLEDIIRNMQSDILKLGERIKELESKQPYEGYSGEGE